MRPMFFANHRSATCGGRNDRPTRDKNRFDVDRERVMPVRTYDRKPISTFVDARPLCPHLEEIKR